MGSAASALEGTTEEPEEELLDTQSLLGLEFSEQSEAESRAAGDSAPAKKAAEGVRVEELLGVSESKEQQKVRTLSPLARRLQHLAGAIGSVVRNPGRS